MKLLYQKMEIKSIETPKFSPKATQKPSDIMQHRTTKAQQPKSYHVANSHGTPTDGGLLGVYSAFSMSE